MMMEPYAPEVIIALNWWPNFWWSFFKPLFFLGQRVQAYRYIYINREHIRLFIIQKQEEEDMSTEDITCNYCLFFLNPLSSDCHHLFASLLSVLFDEWFEIIPFLLNFFLSERMGRLRCFLCSSWFPIWRGRGLMVIMMMMMLFKLWSVIGNKRVDREAEGDATFLMSLLYQPIRCITFIVCYAKKGLFWWT